MDCQKDSKRQFSLESGEPELCLKYPQNKDLLLDKMRSLSACEIEHPERGY